MADCCSRGGCGCSCHGQASATVGSSRQYSSTQARCVTAQVVSRGSCDTTKAVTCCGVPVAETGASGRGNGASLAGHTVVGGGRTSHGSRAADNVAVLERPTPYYGRVVSITDEPTAYGGIYDPSALNRRLAVPPPRKDDGSDAGSTPAPPPLPMRQVVTRTRVTTKKKVKRKVRRSSSTKRRGESKGREGPRPAPAPAPASFAVEDALRQRLQATLEQMSVLQRQLNTTTLELNRARLREEEFRRVNAQSAADRNGAETERRLWAQERSALKEEIRTAQERFEKARSAADKASLKLQTTSNLLEAAEEQARTHSEALVRVQDEVRLLREQRSVERRTVEEAAEFQVVFKRHATELSELRRQLEEAVAAQRQAEARADERLDEIQDARMEIERLQHKVETANKSYLSAERHASNQANRLVQLAQQSESAAISAAANESLLRTQSEALGRAQQRIGELEEALAASKAGHDTANRQVDEHLRRVEESNTTISNLREELMETRAEHKANKVVIEERTRTVTILQQEVEQLTRQLQEAEHHAHSDSTALDRTTADLTRVLEEVHSLRDSNQRLRQQLNDAQSAGQTQGMLSDERLKSVREAADLRCSELEKDLHAAQAEVRRLHEEVSSVKHSHAREVTKLNTRVAEEVELRTSLERRLDAATAAAASEQDVTMTLSNSLTNTSNSLVALQTEVKQLKASNQALKSQLMRTEEQCEVLTQERTTILKQLQQAESTASQVLVDNSDLSQRVLEAEREAARVRREKRDASSKLNELGASYHEAKRDSNALLAQLKASQTQLQGLRRDLGDVISKRNSWEVLERDLQVSSSSKWTADAGGVDVSHGHHHSLDDSFCEVCGKHL